MGSDWPVVWPNYRLARCSGNAAGGDATLSSAGLPHDSTAYRDHETIDPLNADVLYALRAMAMVTISCSATRISPPIGGPASGRLLRIDGVTAGRAARAILSVLPLDSFVEQPALRMEIVDKPAEVPAVQAEVQAEIDAAQGKPSPMGSIERFAFYDLARKSYCVIQTGERRFYGCFVFKKGVIPPDAG